MKATTPSPPPNDTEPLSVSTVFYPIATAPFVVLPVKTACGPAFLRTLLEDALDWGPYEIAHLEKAEEPWEKTRHDLSGEAVLWLVLIEITTGKAHLGNEQFTHWTNMLSRSLGIMMQPQQLDEELALVIKRKFLPPTYGQRPALQKSNGADRQTRL